MIHRHIVAIQKVCPSVNLGLFLHIPFLIVSSFRVSLKAKLSAIFNLKQVF